MVGLLICTFTVATDHYVRTVTQPKLGKDEGFVFIVHFPIFIHIDDLQQRKSAHLRGIYYTQWKRNKQKNEILNYFLIQIKRYCHLPWATTPFPAQHDPGMHKSYRIGAVRTSMFYSMIPQSYLKITKPLNFVSKFVINWTLKWMRVFIKSLD